MNENVAGEVYSWKSIAGKLMNPIVGPNKWPDRDVSSWLMISMYFLVFQTGANFQGFKWVSHPYLTSIIYIQIEANVLLIETPLSTATDFLSSTFPSDGKVARRVRWPMEGLLAN